MPTPPIYRTIAIDVLSGKYNHPDPTCPFTNWHNPIDHEGNFNADQWKRGKTFLYTHNWSTYIHCFQIRRNSMKKIPANITSLLFVALIIVPLPQKWGRYMIYYF